MLNKNINPLIIKAKSNDSDAMLEIINMLKPYIVKNARTTYIKGYDIEDLIQYGIMSAIQAVKSYDVNKNSCFIPYATCAIKNNYNYLIRKICRTNVEASLNNVNDDGFELIEVIADTICIEDEIVKMENKKKILKALKNLKPDDIDILYEVFYKNTRLKSYAEKHMLKYTTCVKRKKKALNNLKREFEKS